MDINVGGFCDIFKPFFSGVLNPFFNYWVVEPIFYFIKIIFIESLKNIVKYKISLINSQVGTYCNQAL